MTLHANTESRLHNENHLLDAQHLPRTSPPETNRKTIRSIERQTVMDKDTKTQIGSAGSQQIRSTTTMQPQKQPTGGDGVEVVEKMTTKQQRWSGKCKVKYVTRFANVCCYAGCLWLEYKEKVTTC